MSIPTFENFQRVLRGTPMAGEARAIYNAALSGGINPALVAGIAGAESSFGSRGYAVGRKNPFGLMGFSFKSYADATTKLAQTLKSKNLGYPQAYGKSGLRGIIGIYTPYGAANGPGNDPSAHTRNIINIGAKTGGDPSSVYLNGRNVPVPSPQVQAPQPRGARGMSVGTGDPELGSLLARQYLEMDRGASVGEMESTAMQIARAMGSRQRTLAAAARTPSGGVQMPTARGGAARAAGVTAPGGTEMLDYGPMGGVVRPLPTPIGGSDYGYSDPEGQDGRHLAKDWFAPGGTALASPVSGTVFRVKNDPNPGQRASNQVFGGSVYIKDNSGRVWVFRHVESPEKYTQAGRRVTAGQRIGAVKPWSGSSHAHIELYKPGPYEYSSARAMDPHAFFTKAGVR
jgi:hypothetical protein